MKAIPAVLAVVLAVAGCAQPEEALAPASIDEGPAPQDASVTGERGAIQGVVVDISLQPVAGAEVRLTASTDSKKVLANSTVGADGAFTFSLLEPAAYLVTASHSQFFEATTLVQVIAQQVARATVTLSDRPTDAPYVELLIINGVSSCGIPFVYDILSLGDNCPFQTEDFFQVNISESWEYGIWELEWADAGEYMMVMVDSNTFCFNTDPCYGVSLQPMPLRMHAIPGELMHEGAYYEPYPEEGFQTWFIVQYGGMFADQVNGALGDNHPCPQDNCYGVGMSIEKRFALYLSVFHHQAPSEPDLYTVVPDT